MDFGRWMAKQGPAEEVKEESTDPISDKLLDEIYENHDQLVSEIPLTAAEEEELDRLMDKINQLKEYTITD